MIKQNEKYDFESISINNKNLTFDYLNNVFNEKKIAFDKYALQLMNKDGKYNNAALLLSDQNPTITKFAIFQGKGVSVFFR